PANHGSLGQPREGPPGPVLRNHEHVSGQGLSRWRRRAARRRWPTRRRRRRCRIAPRRRRESRAGRDRGVGQVPRKHEEGISPDERSDIRVSRVGCVSTRGQNRARAFATTLRDFAHPTATPFIPAKAESRAKGWVPLSRGRADGVCADVGCCETQLFSIQDRTWLARTSLFFSIIIMWPLPSIP